MSWYRIIALTMMIINIIFWIWNLIDGDPYWANQIVGSIYLCTYLILCQIERSAKDSKAVEMSKDWPSKGVKMKMFDF
jgi:hypothetical protein